MKNEILIKIVEQIEKYDLTDCFDTPDDFKKWVNKLNKKQIRNFISLTINKEKIEFPLWCLIDNNLLNCDDYNKRIEAMSKIKNGNGCWPLFENLCEINFLRSKNYYEDIDMISKAATARYPLWVIAEKEFINSKFHKEDFELIVNATNVNREETQKTSYCDVADALAQVAMNKDSINSPYHQADMQMIANANTKCLDTLGCYPVDGINSLAINKESLKDECHLENMKILAENPISKRILYKVMTNPECINGKYYREEINELKIAKSRINAFAIYCFMVNPRKAYSSGSSWDSWQEYERMFFNIAYDYLFDTYLYSRISRENSTDIKRDSDYLKYLKLFNQVDEKCVLYFEAMLSNIYFLISPYKEYDLKLLLSIKNEDIFIDLCKVMANVVSLGGGYHIKDIERISKTEDSEIRKLLIQKATDMESQYSKYHEFDMEYIANLKIDQYSRDDEDKIWYYLFDENGIKHPEHIERLEKLKNNEGNNVDSSLKRYFSRLRNKLI